MVALILIIVGVVCIVISIYYLMQMSKAVSENERSKNTLL